MSTPYYADESVTLHHGDCLDVLRTLPDASVNSCVTSPPYFNQRDYDEPGQYGLEATPAEYVETMRALFAEVRRVLADDGTLFLNLGDSYSTGERPSSGGQPYGTTGRALAGCQGGDCPSTCRCDGHRACVAASSHTVHIGSQRAPESSPCACDPSPDHTESRCPSPDGSGSTGPSPTSRSGLATHDQQQMPRHAPAQPPASQASIPGESSPQHRVECSRSGSRESCPPVPRSYVCGDRQCGHNWACICGTSQPSGSSTAGRKGKESSGSAWGDSTRKFPPAKNLLGIPWRVAFALQDDGWILRSEIVWAKRNCLPDPAKDRPARAHEQVFLFSKKPRYWYDADAIREESDPAQQAHNEKYAKEYEGHTARAATTGQPGNVNNVGIHSRPGKPGRSTRSVWSISAQPFPDAHFAVMPPELAERCILAGCKPGGTVLDPFSGSGTTGMVAQRHGRKYVGIDLNADYLDLSLRTRLQQAALDFGGVA